MALIKSIEDFKKYVRITGTFDIKSMLPFIEDTQKKHIRKHLGDELYGMLETFVENPEDDDDGVLEALLPYVQNPLAKLSLSLAAPFIDLQITDGGFAVTSNTNLSPASKERVASLKDAANNLGNDLIDDLLKFLEDNQEDYEEWVESTAYTGSYETFCRNTTQFDEIVSINGSRLKFLELRPAMVNIVKLQIEPVISAALAAVIRGELMENELSEANAVILPLIQRAEANLAAYDIGMGEKYKLLGLAYLGEVKNILDANPDDYSDYVDSSSYDSDKVSNSTFENEEDNTVFNFGN